MKKNLTKMVQKYMDQTEMSYTTLANEMDLSRNTLVSLVKPTIVNGVVVSPKPHYSTFEKFASYFSDGKTKVTPTQICALYQKLIKPGKQQKHMKGMYDTSRRQLKGAILAKLI